MISRLREIDRVPPCMSSEPDSAAVKRCAARQEASSEIETIIPWVANASSKTFSYVGPQAETMLGYPLASWLEPGFWAAHLHSEDRDSARDQFVLLVNTADRFELEYRMIAADGSIHWFRENVYVSRKENGTASEFNGYLVEISALKKLQAQLQIAYSEIEKLKERLEMENACLREEILLEHDHHEILGQSKAIRRVLKQAEQVGPTDTTVLILGETGTGKELMARTIHELSCRKDRPMVKVNCAALPTSLVESELFGREKGAYTGALTREVGRFEFAHDSTIFLDEIAELPLELQAKLLRVLQEGEFERLGSPKTIKVDVRVLVATSRNLTAAVKEGRFREDLFYRLNVFPIHVPPLRERIEDVPALTWHFVRVLGRKMGRNIESIRSNTMEAFQWYAWPGNVRELRNVVERSLIVNSGPIFQAELPSSEEPNSVTDYTLEEVERRHILETMKRSGWKIRGKSGAAQILALKPTTLESRMKKLKISRPN
jgi:formate hydrogenlyase transcriptional activator